MFGPDWSCEAGAREILQGATRVWTIPSTFVEGLSEESVWRSLCEWWRGDFVLQKRCQRLCCIINKSSLSLILMGKFLFEYSQGIIYIEKERDSLFVMYSHFYKRVIVLFYLKFFPPSFTVSWSSGNQLSHFLFSQGNSILRKTLPIFTVCANC
mgnify:CR=1 FL=1